MYCICVSNRGYQFYLLLETVMYCICVLGDISFNYWRSHVLYMCVRGYQFYLLLEKSCTVYVCYTYTVLFTSPIVNKTDIPLHTFTLHTPPIVNKTDIP